MTTFMAGGLVTSTATFTATSTGLATDPTTITLKYLPGSGSAVTIIYPDARITRVSTGVYSAELDTTGKTGTWTADWTGTGAVQAIAADSWTVTAAPL